MRIDTTALPLASFGKTAEIDPLAADEATRKARFERMLAEQNEAKQMLADITQDGAKGYWEWKIEEMRKQITEQVMGEMNLTPEKLAAMPPEDRLALEDKIARLVEDRLKLAVTEEMKKKKLAESATLNGIIAGAQQVAST
jgi:uncharacterized protein YdcH (DUF465 family)